MAEEEGVVASTSENGWAQVVTDRKEACGDCKASNSHCCASLGGSSKMVAKALNRAGAGPGDLVAVNLGSATVIQSALIVYIIPIIGLVCGAAIGTTSTLGMPISGTAASALFSFAGLAVGFLITALISRALAGRKQFTPVITRIIKAGVQLPESLIAIDPVCKMAVDPQEAPERLVYQNKTYYFCHTGCKESFERKPDKYL